MWQPSAVNGRSISNSKHDNPADLTRYANAAQSTPQPLALLAQGTAADELINLSNMHVSEAPPTTPEAFISGTLPPATFGMCYNDTSNLPENTPLNFMAHLQQYLRQRYRSSTKTAGLPSPWPLQPPPSPFGGTTNSSSVNSAAATTSNGHLLLSPEGLASNVMMSSTRPPPPPPTFFGDATLSNSASSTSLGSPASNSAPVFYMSPLDIFTDTFIRLNALHLSTSNNSSTAATHSHSIQQVLHPINSNTPTMSTAATTEVNNSYGSTTANATATMARVAAAAAAAAMVSFGGGVSPLAVLPPLPLLPPQLLPHQHLFKPYFHMDETKYQQYLEKSTALKKSTTTAATLSTSSLAASLHHNNASKATTTTAASTTKSSSLSTSNTSPTSPINCDLKRASRKRSVDLLLSQQPRNSSKYHQLRGGGGVIVANSTNSDDVHDEEDDDDESLLPPPKKKWIRHYLNGTYILVLVTYYKCRLLKKAD